MKRTLAGVLALGMTTALAACGANEPPADTPAGTPADTPPETDAATARVQVPLDETRYAEAVASTNALGLDLMLAQSAGENVIVSPASLTIALAMLAEGATGEAATELAEILGLGGADRTEAYSALNTALAAYGEGEFSAKEIPEEPFVRMANNVVVLEGYAVNESFIGAVTEHFDATVDSADLTSQAGKDVLDAWVRAQTEGLIEESAIEPNDDLRLVLQNALLFAARWQDPFVGGMTAPREFTRADGSTVQAEMMQRRGEIGYGEAGGYVAIALPYAEDFVAYAVLPPEGGDLTADGIAAAIEAVGAPADTSIGLPKFDLAAMVSVKDYLAGAGVSALFEGEAALLGIADDDLVVGDIAQQGRLIVDEKGTVGAAVTEIAVGVRSMPMRSFYADRSFVFVVRHEATGIDLFTALIDDPTA